MTRHVVVGDVHGCLDELQALVRNCGFGAGDKLCFVGDLVAKGPDSAGVVDFAREANAIAVRGNHDEYVILWKAAVDAGKEPPKIGKNAQRIVSEFTETQFAWLRALPYSHFLRDDLALIHGGLMPGIPFAQQQPEHLLKLRSIRKDGSGSERAAEGTPWAALWEGPPFVIFGHDAVRGLQQHAHAIGLDTGCVYGNRLTAYIVEEERFVFVPARKAYSEIRRAD